MKYVGDVIRIALTVVLLWIVWHHAHWSVALCLTGLAMANELAAYTVREQGKMIRRKGEFAESEVERKERFLREFWKSTKSATK